MESLLELQRNEPLRRCRQRARNYFDLRAQNPASPGVELLGRLREAALSADIEDGMELIYSEFDSHFSRGSFGDIDDLLSALERVDELPVLHLLAIASITNAARDSLSARASFLARLRSYLVKVDAGRVEELLAGLE